MEERIGDAFLDGFVKAAEAWQVPVKFGGPRTIGWKPLDVFNGHQTRSVYSGRYICYALLGPLAQ